MSQAATVVHQIMTKLSEAVSEKDKLIVITKMHLTYWNKIAARIHKLLKIIAFNANGIWRRRYRPSKQLQDLHRDVALLSETHLKHHERFIIPNY
jgi:predicted type IV restriction endonuclease